MSNDRPIKPLRYRQVHLDFHTSEHIPGIGSDFNAREFVETLKESHVDSITLFAKCHHGWSYYPTSSGAPHPNLARPNLLGEMIEACAAAEIETPVYISVQWDERTAREHPEWRVVSATNSFHNARASDTSGLKQLSSAWHSICLNHDGYRTYVLLQAFEIAERYPTQGLFFDIVSNFDCVCNKCIERMRCEGLDPTNAADRLKNDEAVNAQFRKEISTALFERYPHLRIFYNCGHIHKQGPHRFADYSHLEIESLPTGGWGYDHFPSSARYAASLGFDFLGQTGKFHTMWGEFGGFKHPQALEYEVMQMAALGAKCLVGDQLHPSGRLNRDTYKTIAPAYERLQRMEPYLIGARQVSEIAILAAEHFHPSERNHESDDGISQMLLELKRPFDVIDSYAAFEKYRLVILPDDIPVDKTLAPKLSAYVLQGGKLLLSGDSGRNPEGGQSLLDLGIFNSGEKISFEPSYIHSCPDLDAELPESPFVAYGLANQIEVDGATVLADIVPPYFNRSYMHFCSHQHAPEDVNAQPIGPAVTIYGSIGYIAYPIFRMYHQVGQPLYRYLLRGMLDRLTPNPVLITDMPSSGRATLTHQRDRSRYILHLLYAAPQVRGKSIKNGDGTTRVMEMLEDVPAIGPVNAEIQLPMVPSRVFDALTNEDIEWTATDSGSIAVQVPWLHIHNAIIFEGT